MEGFNEANYPQWLRKRAHRVADGDLPRPARAVLIEFDIDGNPKVYSFGPSQVTNDLVRVANESVRALNDVMRALNDKDRA